MKVKNWIVKIDRPEDVYLDPSKFYTEKEIKKYVRSGAMRRAQEKIAFKIINLLDLNKGIILDLGCGPGYTTKIYKEYGFNVIGIDLLPDMLKYAKEKGLYVLQGDMRNLKNIFPKKKFDAVVSASALQWIKEKEDLLKVIKGIHYVLKKGGRCVIQFYPKSSNQLKYISKLFEKNNFNVEVLIENENNPKKRIIFLLAQKRF